MYQNLQLTSELVEWINLKQIFTLALSNILGGKDTTARIAELTCSLPRYLLETF